MVVRIVWNELNIPAGHIWCFYILTARMSIVKIFDASEINACSLYGLIWFINHYLRVIKTL